MKKLKFVVHPIDGKKSESNIVVVETENILNVRFNIVDTAGTPLYTEKQSRVWNGRAWYVFGNPRAPMQNLRIAARDASAEIAPVYSQPFNVGIAVTPAPDPVEPEPEPEPGPVDPDPVEPPPEPVEPVPEPDPTPTDPVEPEPVEPDPTPVEPEPQPEPEPEPEPQPEPEPLPAAILAIDGDFANAKAGEPVRVSVKTQGPITAIEWVIVQANANYSWRGATNTIPTDSSGVTTFDFVPLAGGEFVKVMANNRAIARDSARVPATMPALVSADLAFVRGWRAPLTVGVNIERGAGVNLPQSYFEQLKRESNCTHVRFFLPNKKDWGWSNDDTINKYLNSCAAAMAAGLKVILACMDVVFEVDLKDPKAEDQIKRMARLIAARNFNINMFTVNPWNELGAENNQIANYWRERWVPIFRASLPQHIIANSASQWGDVFRTTQGDLSILADKRVIYEWHKYPWTATDMNEIDSIGNNVRAWEEKNQVIAINGEWAQNGREGGKWLAPERFPEIIPPGARSTVAQQRLCYWTITTGSWYRMNQAGNLNLRPEIASSLRDADAIIRNADWFKADNQPVSP